MQKRNPAYFGEYLIQPVQMPPEIRAKLRDTAQLNRSLFPRQQVGDPK